jgi:hypothetical protein
MPRKRRNVSGADYVWFAALMLFLFALLTGGIYLLVKVLWFPVRKLDSRNTRVVFVILAIGMIVMAAGLLAYQSLSGPDGMSMSSRLSTNVKGFTAFSIFSYFVAIFVTFAYEGELRNAQTMARTMVISPPAIASEYIDPSPSKDDNLSMSITPSSTLRKPDVAEFTHKIWHPQDGKNIEGQKIAIVGYSHYLRGNNIDNENVTISVLESVISGNQRHDFFTKIRNYFCYDSHEEFWTRVYFFNFIPRAIGNESAKYDTATQAMVAMGRARFLRFLEEEQPDKVFIFSSKGWKGFPETTLEEQAGGVCTPLIMGSPEPNWGTYTTKGKHVLVCGFKHPERANSAELSMQVRKFLAL